MVLATPQREPEHGGGVNFWPTDPGVLLNLSLLSGTLLRIPTSLLCERRPHLCEGDGFLSSFTLRLEKMMPFLAGAFFTKGGRDQ